jgi:ABC-type oligopeptide transport system substrate-binding subunit
MSYNQQYQAVNTNYDNSYSYGFQQAQNKANRRSKLITIGSVVGVLALIAIGVGVGVGVSKSHKSSTKSAATTTSSNSSAVQQTDPHDPSSFVKNPALKQSFYGMAYTPYGSQLPNCNNSLGVYCFFPVTSGLNVVLQRT